MGCAVKICGLTSARDVERIAELNPHAVGFIFYAPSRRCVRAEDVACWCRGWPAAIKKVGVFVDVEYDELLRVREVANLDVLQLHGPCQGLVLRHLPGERWCVVHLNSADNECAAASSADALLIDGWSPAAPGGTGTQADWRLACEFVKKASLPVWLAGGLSPENATAAFREVHPFGLDVSSGVEGPDGKKDFGLVSAFIEVCKTL